MTLEDQLWAEISEGIPIELPIKRLTTLSGTMFCITLVFKTLHVFAEFDITEPDSIFKARIWLENAYKSFSFM